MDLSDLETYIDTPQDASESDATTNTNIVITDSQEIPFTLEEEENDNNTTIEYIVPPPPPSQQQSKRAQTPEQTKSTLQFRVEGYVNGRNFGSIEKVYSFQITMHRSRNIDCEHIKTVSVNMFDALPSYSPWILYDLILQKPTTGSVYEVVKIYSCKNRRLYKEDLVNYLVQLQQKNPIVTQGSQDYKRFCKKQLGALSAQTSIAEIKTTITNAVLKEQLLQTLEPAFQGEVFMFLMKYFHSKFLLKILDNGDRKTGKMKIRLLYALLIKRPLVFMFWDLAQRVLLSFKNPEPPYNPLFDVEADGLSINPTYLEFVSNSLIDETVVKYRSSCPVISVHMFQCLLYDLEMRNITCDDFDVDVERLLKPALKLYYDVDAALFKFNTTVFTIHEKHELNAVVTFYDDNNNTESSAYQDNNNNNNKPFKCVLMDFLSERSILVWAHSDYGRYNAITKPQTEALETRIVLNISKHIRNIALFDSNLYSNQYIRKLKTWIQEETDKGNLHSKRMLVFSANKTTSSYIYSRIGIPCISIDDMDIDDKVMDVLQAIYTTEHSKNAPLKEDIIVSLLVERCHKIPEALFDEFLCTLQRCNNDFFKKNKIPINSTISKASIYFDLYLFGDSHDFGSHSRRGAGHLLQEFARATLDIPMQKWDRWNASEPIVKILNALSFRLGVIAQDLQIITLGHSTKWKVLFDVIKKLESGDLANGTTNNNNDKKTTATTATTTTTTKKGSAKNSGPKLSYQIFCSNETDKKELIHVLSKKKDVSSINVGDSSKDMNPATKNQQVQKLFHSFHLGMQVHVMEDDVYGPIDAIWEINPYTMERGVMIKSNATVVDSRERPYSIKVGGETYNTKQHNIVPATVMTVNKYAGKPVDCGIFVAGNKTTLKQLINACKYCLKDFKIYLKPDINISDIKYDHAKPQFNDYDLAAKLYLLKNIFKQ